MGKTEFNTRLTCIKKEIYEPRCNKIQQGLLDRNKEPFGIRPKPFWDLSMETRVTDTKKVLVAVPCSIVHGKVTVLSLNTPFMKFFL